METRQPYPTDVGDEEWAFVAPYLTLMKEDAPQRVYPLREVFNGLRWMVRAGADWRLMPHDLPPWYAVYGQGRRGSKVHPAVDTLGHLLALLVPPANEQDRAQVAALAEAVQEVTGEAV